MFLINISISILKLASLMEVRPQIN